MTQNGIEVSPAMENEIQSYEENGWTVVLAAVDGMWYKTWFSCTCITD